MCGCCVFVVVCCRPLKQCYRLFQHCVCRFLFFCVFGPFACVFCFVLLSFSISSLFFRLLSLSFFVFYVLVMSCCHGCMVFGAHSWTQGYMDTGHGGTCVQGHRAQRAVCDFCVFCAFVDFLQVSLAICFPAAVPVLKCNLSSHGFLAAAWACLSLGTMKLIAQILFHWLMSLSNCHVLLLCQPWGRSKSSNTSVVGD